MKKQIVELQFTMDHFYINGKEKILDVMIITSNLVLAKQM